METFLINGENIKKEFSWMEWMIGYYFKLVSFIDKFIKRTSTSKPQGQIKALCELPGWIKYTFWRQHVSLWLDNKKSTKEISNAIKEMTNNNFDVWWVACPRYAFCLKFYRWGYHFGFLNYAEKMIDMILSINPPISYSNAPNPKIL